MTGIGATRDGVCLLPKGGITGILASRMMQIAKENERLSPAVAVKAARELALASLDMILSLHRASSGGSRPYRGKDRGGLRLFARASLCRGRSEIAHPHHALCRHRRGGRRGRAGQSGPEPVAPDRRQPPAHRHKTGRGTAPRRHRPLAGRKMRKGCWRVPPQFRQRSSRCAPPGPGEVTSKLPRRGAIECRARHSLSG